MDNIKELIALLEAKYSKPLSIVQSIEEKYGFELNKQDSVNATVEDTSYTEDNAVLDNSEDANYEYIKQLLFDVTDLEKMIDSADSIHIKVMEEYKSQLSKLAEKRLASSDKVAEGICKCLKRTLMKLYNVKDYGRKILSYLEKNGFELFSFEQGHKLTNDDLCWLDENLLSAYKEHTDVVEDNYRVINMVQPIIKLPYIEEDEDEAGFHFLPGICKYFVKEV